MRTFPGIYRKIAVVLAGLFLLLKSAPAEAGDCAVCLGKNLSVALSEHSDRLYLRIGDSPRIYFYKPEKPPRIVAKGLDPDKRYLVRVYYDDRVVVSWYLDFRKLDAKMATIWRSPGAWRMDAGKSGKCTWPME